MTAEDRVGQLPKWAQEHVAELTRQRNYWHAETEKLRGELDTTVAVVRSEQRPGAGWGETVQGLGAEARVRFALSAERNDYVEVGLAYYRPDGSKRLLRVSHSIRQVQIMPHAANLFFMGADRG